ncbi:hypothetical protein EVA_18412 [gut metagenome]|uniref:Uncharacterized protein n=1 Tax=gut metagenome TaxID=749906 RepID=J9FEZ5_9ZZZZ
MVGPLLGGVLGSMMPTRFVLVTTGCILMASAAFSYFTRVKGKKEAVDI